MKFACHSCGAKYQIADEKLGRKGVKVRCKKCGATIVVRPEAHSEESSEDATVVGPHPLGGGDSAQSLTDSVLLPGLPPSETEPTQAASFVSTGAPLEEVGPPPEVPPVAPAADSEPAPPMGDAIPLPGARLAPPAEDLSIPTGAELEGLKDSLQSELADGLDLDPPGPDPKAFGASPSSTLTVGGPSSGLPGSAAETSPSASSLPPQDSGAIESELGSAFAAMFSPEGIASDSAPVEPAIPHEPAGSPGAAVNGSSQTPSPAAGTWFVAIRDEQVGPMTFEQVREHWMRKDLDPDSLCWQQGMPDWTAMRNVPEWAQLPDWEARLAAAPSSEDLSYEGVPAFVASEGAPAAAPAPEPQWRPSAASALDSLAQEELTSSPPPGLDPISSSAPGPSPFSAASGPMGPPAAGAVPTAGFGAPVAAPPAAEAPAAAAAPMLPAAGVSPILPSQVQPRSGGNRWVWAAALLGVLVLAGGAFAMLQPTIQSLAFGPSGADGAGPAGAQGEGSSASGAEGAPKPMVATAPDLGPASSDAGRPEDGPSSPPAPDSANPAAAAQAAAEPESKKASESASKVREPEPDEGAERAPPRRNVRRKPRPRPRPRPPSQPPPSTGSSDDLLGAARSPGPSGLPKTLDEADVLTVLRQHAADVRGCVAKQKADDPSVNGTMQVKVVIAGSGRPVRVSVSPARFRNATVGRCVVASAKQWRFPKFASATFPVDFPVVVQ